MPPGIRVKINPKAVEHILKVDVVPDLERRARNIADQAGEGFEVGTFVGEKRARTSVITATADAMLAEATEGRLTGALDAGRA